MIGHKQPVLIAIYLTSITYVRIQRVVDPVQLTSVVVCVMALLDTSSRALDANWS